MIKSLDPNSWFNERELDFTPCHFVVSNTKITRESKLWILENLRGRFSITTRPERINLSVLSQDIPCPAFEDPKEAVIYELTWS